MPRGTRTSGGARRRAPQQRAPRRLALLVLAVALTAGAVYAGVQASGSDATSASGEPSASPTSPSSVVTPMTDVDLSSLPIERGPFCAHLEDADVETALGGPVASTAHYDSGDRVRVAPGVTDVAHEFDCTYVAASGAQARAWVFAEPVTRRVGARLAHESRAERGCAPVRAAPRYGDPTATTLCRTDGAHVLSLRGLFGDAWLSCQLRLPRPTRAAETVRRGEQWCLRVATTLGARP